MQSQARGGLYVLIGRVVIALSAMAIVILVARGFSKEVSAYYQLAYSVVLLFSIVGQGGMPNAAMRFVALASRSGEADYGRIGLAALSWSVLASLCAYIVLVVSVPFVASVNSKFGFLADYRHYVALWGAVFALQGVTAELFRAHHLQGKATLFGGVLSQLSLLAIVWGLGATYAEVGLKGLFAASVASVSAPLVLCIYYLYAARVVRGGAPFAVLKSHSEMVFAGLKNVGIGLLSYLILQSNIWIVAYFGSTDELALFSVANRLVGALAIVSVVISGAYLPRITRLLVDGDIAALNILVSKVSFLATSIAVFVLVIIFLFSEQIISLLFGSSYESASSYLLALSLGFFLTSLAGLRSQILMVSGRESVQLRITAVSSIFYVLIVGSIASRYGVLAAVRVGAVALGVVGFVEVYFLKRYTGVLSLPWHYLLDLVRRGTCFRG